LVHLIFFNPLGCWLHKKNCQFRLFITFAEIAQLVEQRIRNAWVVGSNPILGSLSLCETQRF
jgi:hypothetical protein